MLGKGAVAGAGGERPAPRRRAGGEYRIAKLNRKAWPEGGGGVESRDPCAAVHAWISAVLLQTASSGCCLLPVVCCLLPAASCLLPAVLLCCCAKEKRRKKNEEICKKQ